MNDMVGSINQPQSTPANQTTNQEDQTALPPLLIVIMGPTAVGKTSAAIDLALRFNGEVINADSRYLYRGMDIGVAKPDMAERRGIPHHLIDIVRPDEEMSLATYQELAYRAINDSIARGHLPFLVGGTPLYINAVVEGWHIPRVPPNPAFRAQLEEEIARDGIEPVAARLAQVDPIAAERSGRNPRRVIRALEIYDATGIPMSQQEGKGPRPYRTIEFGLTMPRPQLYEAIDRRVEDQIALGLVEEVQSLLDAGLAPDASAMSSLGYRQLVPYLRDEITLEEAVTEIKHATHRYVRHQETWLRRNPHLIPIDVTEPGWIDWMTKAISNQQSAISNEHMPS
jgi:tRNA dimethylallyltransferase